MTTMRAKLRVHFVQVQKQSLNAEGKYDPAGTPATCSEVLHMSAVCAPKYDASGLDEDNTFAKYSPSATLMINVANPALFGKFEVGQAYYVDFTPAP